MGKKDLLLCDCFGNFLVLIWVEKKGAMVKVLAFHQCPGSIPARRHMWVELVTRVFLRVLQFCCLHNIQHSKFHFEQDGGPT